MSRDTWINLCGTAFTFGYIALILLVGIFAYRHDHRQGQQEQGEPSGLEAFDAEYYELYQTGLWLLGHKEQAPYDDL